MFSQHPMCVSSLTRLSMARLPKVTDEGLKSVGSLTALAALDLSHTAQLTRAGLPALHSLSRLTKLKCDASLCPVPCIPRPVQSR